MFKTLVAVRKTWQYLDTFVFPGLIVCFFHLQTTICLLWMHSVCVYLFAPHSHKTTMRILRSPLKWQNVSLSVEISGSSELWEGHALATTLVDCHFSLTSRWVSQLSLYCSPLEAPPSEIILLLRQAVKGTPTPLWQINLEEHVLVRNLCPSPAMHR